MMKVYSYGITEITSGIELLDDQLRRYGLYYDTLIKIELEKRRRKRDVRATRRPVIGEINAKRHELTRQIDELYKKIRDRRQKESGRRILALKKSGVPREKAQRRGAKRTRYADLEAEIEKLKAERKKVAKQQRKEEEVFAEDVAPDQRLYARERAILASKPGKQRETIATLNRIEKAREQEKKAKEAKDTARCSELRAELKQLGKKLNALKVGPTSPQRSKINDPVLQTMLADPGVSDDWKELAKADQWQAQAISDARENSGLEPGSYLLANEAAKSAIEDSYANGKDPEPRGYERDGYEQREGRIGVFFGESITVNRLSDNNHIVINPLPADQWSTRQKRRHARTTGRMRIGWTAPKIPRWCEFKLVQHRPLPADAKVVRACIVRRRVGRRYRHELQLTVKSDMRVRRLRGVGAVRVLIGWTKLPDEQGLRVATWSGDDGKSGELVLLRTYENLQFPDALRGISDRLFDEAVAALLVRLRTKKGLPRWMKEAATGIHQWRKHQKLGIVAYRWCRELLGEDRVDELWGVWSEQRLARWEREVKKLTRQGWSKKQSGKKCADHKLDKLGSIDEVTVALGLSGDEALAFWLELWRRKNRHLYDWEANARERAHRERRERYRLFAAEMAGLYGDCHMSDINLAEVAKLAKPDEDDRSWEEARKNRRYAAVSTLRAALQQALLK